MAQEPAHPPGTDEEDSQAGLDQGEEKDVSEHRPLSALVIYEAVRREGKEELERPPVSLSLSGLTAGLGMGLSLAAQGALHAYLPDAPWRPLIEDFGYSVGFLIVILSRHQLFTENTLSAVLPVLHPPAGRHALELLRLWSIVFFANLVGTALFSAIVLAPPLLSDQLRSGMIDVAGHLGAMSTSEVFWRAIPAGWIIATLVWMLPSAETAKVWVILLLTYLISLLQLTHVVAGAAEVFLLTFTGQVTPARALFGFIVPMLVGNVIGGSALFAMLSFGQVRQEMEEG